MHEVAVKYRAAGLSVIPVGADKRPLLASWKPYQERLPSETELASWFASSSPVGIAVIAGAVSEHVEVLDFDNAGSEFKPWAELLVASGGKELFARLVIEKTPSGGWHVGYRCLEGIEKNQKLAATSSDAVLIETRGQGGYVVVAPSPNYVLRRGDWAALPVISVEERDLLLTCARALDQRPPKPKPIPASAAAQLNGSRRPGDEFNERAGEGEVAAILEHAGWTPWRNHYWTRPGKNCGVSGSLFPSGVFHCFTSNGAPFASGESYSPFSVLAIAEHGGDYSAAARALALRGYGEKKAKVQQDGQPTSSGADPKTPLLQFLPLLTISQARELAAETHQWIWTDYLARGAVTLLHGAPKRGKTTLNYMLISAVSQGKPFLGRATTQVPIIYMGEDPINRVLAQLGNIDESLFRFQTARTLRTKLRVDDLTRLLAEKAKAIGAGLVIVDTLSAWAGFAQDGENCSTEANRVMAAFAALANDANVAVLLLHHTKKGATDDPIESARGSSGIVGAADHVMYLRSDSETKDNRRRILASVGRFVDCPAELAIELSDNGEQYAVIERGPSALRNHADVINVLPSQSPGLTATALTSLTTRSASSMYGALSELHGLDAIRREGTGSRGNPYTYWKSDGWANAEPETQTVQLPSDNLTSIEDEFAEPTRIFGDLDITL